MTTAPPAWDFTEGCEDLAVARYRADTICGLEVSVAADFPHYSRPYWLTLAITATAALLHAGALTRTPPEQVRAWAWEGLPHSAVAAVPPGSEAWYFLRVLRSGTGPNDVCVRQLVRRAVDTLAASDPRQPATPRLPAQGTPMHKVLTAAVAVAAEAPLHNCGWSYGAAVPWERIGALRDALDAAGVDWRKATAPPAENAR